MYTVHTKWEMGVILMVDLLGFENFLELTSWLILVVDLFGFEDGEAGESG